MRGGSCRLNKRFQGSWVICYSERGQPFVSVPLLYEVFVAKGFYCGGFRNTEERWKWREGKQAKVCIRRTLVVYSPRLQMGI